MSDVQNAGAPLAAEGPRSIDATPSPRLLEVLGDIPLQPWQCLAELIDNSLDELARGSFEDGGCALRVDVTVAVEGAKSYLTVLDNGLGMTLDQLETSVKAGSSSKSRYGTLGLFGMGFNIATARLGSSTRVRTTTQGAHEWLEVDIDFLEMQRSESYIRPVRLVPKDDPEVSGTEIRITLKRDPANYFALPANLQALRTQLGSVYSYLLRDSIPGVEGKGISSPIPAEIWVADKKVEPKLPCVWSDKRTVQYSGQAVNAVQYIDIELSQAVACLSCGNWTRDESATQCGECESTRVERRSRRIFGWLGVQRYIDSTHYGIDYFRFGRKILIQDKSIFTYTDPDTFATDVEYPIEMPANRGRLVGEIHLDHVPVTYQKNDFDRGSRDWQKAIEEIRGTSPLKPRNSGGVNVSKLAILFSAFRRNDPGLKCLIPGDGKVALHTQAAEWGKFFDRGVTRFLGDDEWYAAAERHQNLRDGVVEKPSEGGTSSGSGSVIRNTFGGGHSQPGSDSSPGSTPKPHVTLEESRDMYLEKLRLVSQPREDLSGRFELKSPIGTWIIKVLQCEQEVVTPSRIEAPATVGLVAGNEVEVFVNVSHNSISEFGREVRDLALLAAAETIHELKCPDTPVTVIYSELVMKVEDLRSNAASTRGRINALIGRVREYMHRVVSEDPSAFWDSLSADLKSQTADLAAQIFPNTRFDEVVDSGDYALALNAVSLAALVEESPAAFFEGKVFKASIRLRSEDAKRRLVMRIVRGLQTLGEYPDDPTPLTEGERNLAEVYCDVLEQLIRPEDAR